ncbi:polyketide synthase Pks13 [Nocardia stercoris]|uniref:Acyltransferase domain-containing protein n=1 Tax=Nocardia stercoris TaxID=2483361 RepID=A0A3M2L9D9_9NOCA|nr:polyketide synthase Pks13 [Nocardia stercoris]RMI34212.1 acyltransferase domain-containing protein [Nocardia stercoris]
MAENEGTQTNETAPDVAVTDDNRQGTELSVAELREWLRNWVAQATGQPVDNITVDRPMEEFGLASRDALALGGDIEELTGVTLTPTVVYQHPTISSLAEVIAAGGVPEELEAPADITYTAAAYSPNEAHDIAIIGLATRFPGAGETPDSTWDFLINRGDGISDLPEGRWSEFAGQPILDQQIAEANTKGGYLTQEQIKNFDAEFFALSPIEVERMDPQQRLALELTWEALEHARIPANTLKGEQVGVYIGSTATDFSLIAMLGAGNTDPGTPASADAYGIMGSVSSIIANRVSYFFDFHGPSQSIDTACSSTLVAVHDAVRGLRNGETDLALAGGTNMLLSPAATIGFDTNGGVAKDGHIKAFSSDADGMVRSEGGGLVVLKRLVDAERDGDSILAVIKGSAVNNDGRSNGILAPNPAAQADCLRAAYRDARFAPTQVDYIEAHGTGTPIGDPIEADALARVVGRGRAPEKPALLGSVKTNFGHLEAAAGAASLAKVVMSLQHNVIPPNLGFAGGNPYIPWDTARLQVVDQPTEFPRYSGKATIGVSGFGFGGTNAHIVVQEYVSSAAAPAVTAKPLEEALDNENTGVVADAEAILAAADAGETDTAEPELAATAPVAEWTDARTEPLPVILPVSAYLPSRRKRAAADLADWLETEAGQATPLVDVARALAKRNHGRSRGVVLATTHAEAIAGLRAIAAGKPQPGVFTADSPASHGAMWVFSGFGAQHRKMAKQLYLENTIFARAVDQVDELVEFEAGFSPRERILDDEQDWTSGWAQIGIFTVQVGLAALLRAHGAEPEAVVGHSLGEAAEAYVAGGLSLEDAVRLICARGRLMAEGEEMLTDDDVRRMALVELSADDVTAMLPDYPGIEVAVYAAPTNTVIGGPEEQVQAIVDAVEAQGKFARVLQAKGAGHTSQMDPLLGELAAELAGIEPTTLATDLYSTVIKDGVFRAGDGPIHDVDYWVTNLRHSVYFTNAVRRAVDNGITTFLELAPNSVSLMQVLGTTYAAGAHNAALIYTLKRKEDESAGVIAALAQLYVHGHEVDLVSLVPAGDTYADIPRTAFLRKEHWLKASMGFGVGNRRMPGTHVPLPDGRHAWEVEAHRVTDLASQVTAAAASVLSDVVLGATATYGELPASGTLTTMLTPHPGGASVQVHAKQDNGFRLLFDAVVTAGGELAVTSAARPAAIAAAPVAAEPVRDAAAPANAGERWVAGSGESVVDRLKLITAESMGYAVEDLPMEIPLMELGLDSLMAMRIKNRVEYEFDIPQLQIAAVRDASLTEVAKVLEYAIEHRDEMAAMAEQQAAGGGGLKLDDEFIEAARAAAESGADPIAVVQEKIAAAAPEPAVTQEVPVEDVVAVPPRDGAERLTYAAWATVTGKAAGGIFHTLPVLDDATMTALAQRLSERVDADITVEELRACTTIEQMSDVVRIHQDDNGGLDGFVRTLRARTEGSTATPVFVFHPSGGNTLVYEPLLRRLPADTPMYGFERVEGSIEERARQYIPEIRKIQPEGPYVFYGWSLGAVFALQCAQIMRAEGVEVELVGLIDLAMPSEPESNTAEERVERMRRYQAFAKTTYGFDGELDEEQLEELAAASDEEQIKIVFQLLEFAGAKIPAGVLEHQRTSWIEGRELQKVQLSHYDGKTVLYLADKYHDGLMELEPRFADRAPNGGWSEYIPDLEVIHIPGDHLQIVDEPRIATVGADLTRKLGEIAARAQA